MNVKLRSIEVDARTADVLEALAASRGTSVSELLADLLALDDVPADFEAMRSTGTGPWAPAVLAEDARRFAAFRATRQGIPWE